MSTTTTTRTSLHLSSISSTSSTSSASFQSRPKTTPQTPSSPLLASNFKRKTMSITQTYFLAHKARAKLSQQAARPDHNLRLLVGHANLLDSLMLELADAEREQESWFNQSVRGATKSEEKERHVQWADTVIEEPEEDWQAEDADSDSSDSDSDFDGEEDVEMADVVSYRRVPAHDKIVPVLRNTDSYDNMEEEDDEEDYAQLTLTRSPSHSASPPELDHDSDSSEDEVMPPSPPTDVLHTFSEKQQQEEESIATTTSYYNSRQEDDKDAFYDEGFYLPPRNPARLVTAISIY